MSEFMCHLLEHRSRSGWPLGFVRVVRAEKQGGKGSSYGSRGCEHYPAERMRYCAFLIVPLFSTGSAISEGIKQKQTRFLISSTR